MPPAIFSVLWFIVVFPVHVQWLARYFPAQRGQAPCRPAFVYAWFLFGNRHKVELSEVVFLIWAFVHDKRLIYRPPRGNLDGFLGWKPLFKLTSWYHSRSLDGRWSQTLYCWLTKCLTPTSWCFCWCWTCQTNGFYEYLWNSFLVGVLLPRSFQTPLQSCCLIVYCQLSFSQHVTATITVTRAMTQQASAHVGTMALAVWTVKGEVHVYSISMCRKKICSAVFGYWSIRLVFKSWTAVCVGQENTKNIHQSQIKLCFLVSKSVYYTQWCTNTTVQTLK